MFVGGITTKIKELVVLEFRALVLVVIVVPGVVVIVILCGIIEWYFNFDKSVYRSCYVC